MTKKTQVKSFLFRIFHKRRSKLEGATLQNEENKSIHALMLPLFYNVVTDNPILQYWHFKAVINLLSTFTTFLKGFEKLPISLKKVPDDCEAP